AEVASVTGTAVWRARPEVSDAKGGSSSFVLQLDLVIPERKLSMTMSMRKEAASSAMSHLMEIRFLREDKQPDGDIANIANVIMAANLHGQRSPLAGRVVRVAPGVFLFGLLNSGAEREQNLSNLKEMNWFQFPLTYRNGSLGLLTAEKGAVGERAL